MFNFCWTSCIFERYRDYNVRLLNKINKKMIDRGGSVASNLVLIDYSTLDL